MDLIKDPKADRIVRAALTFGAVVVGTLLEHLAGPVATVVEFLKGII